MKNFTCAYIRVGGLVMTASCPKNTDITVGIVDDFGNVIHILETDTHASSVAIKNFE